MKSILRITLMLPMLVLLSCIDKDNNEILNFNSVEAKGIIDFDQNSKKISYSKKTNTTIKLSENQHTINHTFIFEKGNHSFSNKDDLKKFILEHPSEINGRFEILIDDELVYSVQIINGQKFNGKIYDSSLSNKLKSSKPACSFQQVKACAIERIHNQNWFDMTLCILDGFGCVVNNYASCTVDLCM